MGHYLQPIVDYIGNHPNGALAIVFMMAMGEALFVIGLFVPSTVVLVGAGTLVGMGKLEFVPIFTATALGATAGDAISYWFGHTYKEKIRRIWPFSRYTGMLDRGEAYFARHGGKSVFIGRFIPGIKSVVPGIAGIVGMSPVRFTIINVVSAIAWTASHLLPGVGIGRGIDVASSGNPRLLELFVLVLVVAFVATYAARFAFGWLLPHAELWRTRLGEALLGLPVPGARFLRRLLLNEENILVPFAFFALALLGLSGFTLISVAYFADPAFVRADESISAYLQSLRTEPFDRLMVGVTMLGDGMVLGPVAAAVLAVFLWHRRWRMAGALATAFVSAALFVPLIKAFIHRARPIALYNGADSYSFPSGHATLAATIIGMCVLVAARDLPSRVQRAVYVLAAITIGLIAFSRLYLAAHWPSDVGAGLLFGGALVFGLAWLLHGRSYVPASSRSGIAALVCLMLVYPVHLYLNYTATASNYVMRIDQTLVTQERWLADSWADVPLRRVLLDGDYGEPVLVQTNLDMSKIADTLTKAGWSPRAAGQLARLVDSILPSRRSLDEMSVLPLTNHGHAPIAVFTRPAPQPAGARQVLRVWTSGTSISEGGRHTPLLLISVTTEIAEPIGFGFALAEALQMTASENDALGSVIANSLGGSVTLVNDADGHRLLLVN
ncbi:bifunctional DedA family/phosphatase PAP2 family protein [Hoeflea alexandrii]|uniref:bifunctional DedA family/phosphatase PAP2 family protein n=1 Tax=Hoeflea alexandrii TaxID=288436 RepID=UPI0022AEF3B6|nr:bifunctional DedA family/phosphatase PAP2 family protein [Hoeflea alexandrii]MCZ4291455.1 VTT domain-containing protein [Hoeflea alexandrii]